MAPTTGSALSERVRHDRPGPLPGTVDGQPEDGGQAFAGVVEAEGLLDEAALALESVALELDAEGIAEDFHRVGVGVQSACDRGDQVLTFGEAAATV